MSNPGHFYLVLSQGVNWLSLALELGGFLVCMANRALSPMMTLAAAGFAGLAASGLVSRLVPLVFPGNSDRIFLSFLVASVIGLVSMLALIFGLAASFSDIRRRLGLRMEPPHVRK